MKWHPFAFAYHEYWVWHTQVWSQLFSTGCTFLYARGKISSRNCVNFAIFLLRLIKSYLYFISVFINSTQNHIKRNEHFLFTYKFTLWCILNINMRQLFKMKCNQTVKYSNKPWKLIFVHEALESVCTYALCYCDQSGLLSLFISFSMVHATQRTK